MDPFTLALCIVVVILAIYGFCRLCGEVVQEQEDRWKNEIADEVVRRLRRSKTGGTPKT